MICLDGQIGNRIQGVLQTGRETDGNDVPERIVVKAHFPEIKPGGVRFFHQIDHNERCGDALGECGCQRHSRHIHPECDDKDHIHHNIGNSGNGQIPKRRFGIAARIDHCRAEIVDEHGRNTGKIDPDIGGGEIKNIRRGVHETKTGFGKRDSDQGHGSAA